MMGVVRMLMGRPGIDAEFNAAYEASAENIRRFARQHGLSEADEALCLQDARAKLTAWKTQRCSEMDRK